MSELESYLKNKNHLGPVYGLMIALGQIIELRLWDGSGHEELNFEKFITHCGEGRQRVFHLGLEELNLQYSDIGSRDGLHCFKFENNNLELL